MKATVVTMTRELAKDYLSRNTQNRKVKSSALNFYKKQMSSGTWKENGEPIIIDTNGVIKDGQHRLMAVAETGYAYRVPVISGISPDVMDTIDTGTNRSAGDVLQLEGFKNATRLASIIKAILLGRITTDSANKTQISNNDILSFAIEKKSYLDEIMKTTLEIYNLQVAMVLTATDIGYYVYTYGNTEEVKTFLKMISGSIREPKTATDYVYKKLYQSKMGDNRLSKKAKREYISKAFLKYTQGNPIVKSLKLSNKNG
jgi:hypothetical protein